jgi:ABC-2 type transport system permease protein
MKPIKRNIRESQRIIWSITGKDIADGLKNKSILSIFLLVFFMMVWIPTLWSPSSPHLVIYDEGNSLLAAKLENDPTLRLHPKPSFQEFQDFMAQGDNGEIGLVIPAESEQNLGEGQSLELRGYVLWASRSNASRLKTDLEQRLTELNGQPVSIMIKDTVIPQPGAMGPIRMASLTLVVTITFIGVFSVPHLMLEEKQTKTLDTLLISPASIIQVITGKALAGMFYCLVIGVTVLAFNQVFVVHWGLVILAVLCSALFSVGLGLALGIFVDTKQKLITWMLVLSQPLLVPVFLSMIDPILPESLRDLLPWMPAVAQSLLFRFSFSTGVSISDTLSSLSIVSVCVLLTFCLVVWQVRRMDR